MCYYNGAKVTPQDYIDYVTDDKIKAEYDKSMQSGFSYETWPVIVGNGEKRIAEMAHWEFIPYWLKDWKEVEASRKKYTTLNAKGETLLTSRIYKEAGLKRRCLVMSSGFYEWRHFAGKAYPYHISVEGKKLFFMAGVWQPWTDKETGEVIDTFALCTTEANNLMTQVHNTKKRMPTILTEDLAQEWLFEGLKPKRITEIATSHTKDMLVAKTIRKDFRQIDNPQESEEYPELPPLEIA
jgi:putative SOS response-associated peptidase YedK